MKTNTTKLAATYLSKTIAALRHRNYRLWFIGQKRFHEWLCKLDEVQLNTLIYTFTTVLAEEKDL
jgi:hypothetical protein